MANQRTREVKTFRKLAREIKRGFDPKKIPKKVLENAGEIFIEEIKNRATKGQSPIREFPRRFPAYAAQRKKGDGVKRYPDTVKKKFPSKRKRPVNLTLSGKFLNSLKYKVKRGKRPRITVGFFNRLSRKKEKGHREGANQQPLRPIIPQGRKRDDRESFVLPITRRVEQYLVKALDKWFTKNTRKR
jgi:hypothetical protein